MDDLARAEKFYTGMGWTKIVPFSNEVGTCIKISNTIYVMLLLPSFFQEFTPKKIADAHSVSEALLGLSANSKQEVDELMEKAIVLGGKETRPPQDHGFMYGRDFEDPDGHIWELFWMQQPA